MISSKILLRVEFSSASSWPVMKEGLRQIESLVQATIAAQQGSQKADCGKVVPFTVDRWRDGVFLIGARGPALVHGEIATLAISDALTFLQGRSRLIPPGIKKVSRNVVRP